MRRPDAFAHLRHQRRQRLVPDLVRLHHREALLARPVEIVRRIAGAAQADLPDLVAGQQALFDGASKWCAVGNALAEHVVVHVRMRIHMHQRDRAVLARHRAQDRQRDGVIAAQRQRRTAGGQHRVVEGRNDVDRLLERIGVDGHIAQVGHVQLVERRCAGGHVVGPQQRRFGADLARPETRARSVGSADVERHADERRVQPLRGRCGGQPHHRAGAGEARHRVAAERLVRSGGGHRVGGFSAAGRAAIRARAAAWW